MLEGILSYFGGVVVADVRIEGGNEHERIFEIPSDLLEIGFDADEAFVNKVISGVGEKPDRLEKVESDNGAENVELEMAL